MVDGLDGRASGLADAREVDLSLRLPDAGGGPVASPWLEDEAAEPAAGPGPPLDTLPGWSAPGVVLDWPDAWQVLSTPVAAGGDRVRSPTNDPDATTLAGDFRFVAQATAMVLELTTRGRLLPVLESTADGWQARWRPLIDSRDRARVEGLLWSLPLSFLAAGPISREADATPPRPPSAAPGEVLRSLMWGLTDSMARRFAGERTSTPPRRPKRTSGPAGAWLEALVSSDGIVEGDGDDLAALAGRLQTWQATAVTFAEPVRTCFRIVPPDEIAEGTEGDLGSGGRQVARPTTKEAGPEGGWRIEFALQAVDDPSLIVPAAAVWDDGPELTALERHVARPDEVLLRGLGRAARLVHSLGPALAEMAPCGQSTDAAGVLAFLRDGAPVLEEGGFGVLAPPWWRSSRPRLGLRLKARTGPKTAGSTGTIGLDGLCDIRWEAVLGDEKLGLAELRALARLKQPLVRLRGQWVELHEEDLAAAITAVGRRGAGAVQLSAGQVLRTALGLEPAADGLPVAAVVADGWLGDLLAGADDRRLRPIPTPHGFDGSLRPYQERGVGWLAFLGDLRLGACLADDMGLGKTAQLLALLLEERGPAGKAPARRGPTVRGRGRAAEPTLGPTLVLCPMSLVGNWQREAARFTPKLSVYVHHGPERLAGKAFTRKAVASDLVLSTYGLAARDQQLLATVAWRRMVLDEAQQIKNSAARTTQSVRAIPAERRIAMTGTPVENRLSELWSIMQFLNPGMLGSEKAFRERFSLPIERDGDDEAAARLRRITGPFVLRRLKTDRSIIADLPDKLEMKEFCNLTREQASLYQAVVDDMLARIDE
ncbi:MAG: ATP-dependent helicase, partial [Acidobacteriota bacterium]|nr:ATP-dependent helicase [Acidobacteriota bacterium]